MKSLGSVTLTHDTQFGDFITHIDVFTILHDSQNKFHGIIIIDPLINFWPNPFCLVVLS